MHTKSNDKHSSKVTTVTTLCYTKKYTSKCCAPNS